MTRNPAHTPARCEQPACECGKPATHHNIITVRGALRTLETCDDCYAREYPERAATFELARRAPNAGEFRDPALRAEG